MTFENYLTQLASGPEVDAPCFNWDYGRISQGKKGLAGSYPYGVLDPLVENVGFGNSCCKSFQRLYNLTIYQCPQSQGFDYMYTLPNPDKINGFVNQLHLISSTRFLEQCPDVEGIDAVENVLDPYTFMGFDYLGTPRPLTYDEGFGGYVTTLRFSVDWQKCF